MKFKDAEKEIKAIMGLSPDCEVGVEHDYCEGVFILRIPVGFARGGTLLIYDENNDEFNWVDVEDDETEDEG